MPLSPSLSLLIISASVSFIFFHHFFCMFVLHSRFMNYILINGVKGSLFSTSLITLVISFLFDDRHSENCEVTPHRDFGLYVSDCKQCWASFKVPIDHLYIFFRQTIPKTYSYLLPVFNFFIYIYIYIYCILCHPLLFLPSIFPNIRVFSNESVLPMSWPNFWSFSFSISPFKEYSGLISFRMDWLDLLAVQETLKSLLQYYS